MSSHRYYDPATQKAVPIDAVVLDLCETPEGADNNYPAWLRLVARSEQLKGNINYRPAFLRWLADQIEAQTKPPRIPEPGLWGVVEARRHDQSKVDRCTWIRRRGMRPWRCDCGLSALWHELVDPVLIRDGIEVAS